MKHTSLLLGVLLSVSLMTTGCVNIATATVDPSSNLSDLKTLHVAKIERDQRGINVLIADKFRSRGFTVSTGPGKPPGTVDAVVTYADKWQWDITMYLLDLTVTIRDAKSDFPMATGNSRHTSLTRKSPQEMVDEVIDNIFSQQGINSPATSVARPTTAGPTGRESGRETPATKSSAERLRELNDLFKNGLIDQKEYEERKRKVLDSI